MRYSESKDSSLRLREGGVEWSGEVRDRGGGLSPPRLLPRGRVNPHYTQKLNITHHCLSFSNLSKTFPGHRLWLRGASN